jgi:hypothetical protein
VIVDSARDMSFDRITATDLETHYSRKLYPNNDKATLHMRDAEIPDED